MTDRELMEQATEHILGRMRREGWKNLDGHDQPTAWDINNGWCVRWARRVRYLIPRAHSRSFDDNLHAWVELDGRFYDAECLDGVDDWEDLPFFRDELLPPFN